MPWIAHPAELPITSWLHLRESGDVDGTLYGYGPHLRGFVCPTKDDARQKRTGTQRVSFSRGT